MATGFGPRSGGRWAAGALAFLGAAAVTLAYAACAPRARMCTAAAECGPGISCVAGRCLPDAGVPAIQNARRLVIDPVDVAYVRRGAPAGRGAVPPVFTLGKDGESEAVLFLRFDVPLAPEAKIFEAYVLLDRTELADVDPGPITLHAARIVEPWDGLSLSWAVQPRVQETRSPTTQVAPAGPTTVRIDVRDLVLRWAAHEKADQGIAIVSEGQTPTGIAFALLPLVEPSSAVADPGAVGGTLVDPRVAEASRVPPSRRGPRLELYVK